MTQARLRDLLAGATAHLAAAGSDGAARDARALLSEAAGVPRDRLGLHLADPPPDAVAARLEGFLARRAAGEPVSRILGRRGFWGREFTITPDVLDPRPETETLIAAALESGPPAGVILDLGTGSGVLAVTLLAEWAGVRAVATDISKPALEVARANAARHGVADRLDLRRADWFAGLGDLRGRCGLVVSNPPYVTRDEMSALAREVREHDPAAALTDGGDGLAAHRMLAGQGAGWLAPGGRLLAELGWRQGAAVRAIFAASGGWKGLRLLPDLDGRDRVIAALRPG